MTPQKDIVIIPCFQRPEFLGACLHYIQQADHWDEHLYYFCVDNHRSRVNQYDPEVLEVIKAFPGLSAIDIRKPHSAHGNSLNLLEGYKTARNRLAKEEGSNLIYLIETDIFISKSYFTFHRNAWKTGNPYFVSACRNQNAGAPVGDEVDQVYTHQSYQSLGVSWKPSHLDRIIPHATLKYYLHMGGYCRQHFPRSSKADTHTEQDGLIGRVVERDNLVGMYPFVPRAYHAGYVGYNRNGKRVDKRLPLQERIDQILSMSEEEMNSRAVIKDITMCDLSGRSEPDQLSLVEPWHHLPGT